MKKAVSTWIWVVGSFIIAMLLLGIATNVIGNMAMENHKRNVEDEFYKMIGIINSLCDSNEGQSYEANLKFPDIVDKIYSSRSSEYVEKEITYGNYLCINYTRLECKKLDCLTKVYVIGKKENLLGIVDKLTGNRNYYNYSVRFTRVSSGVLITSEETKNISRNIAEKYFCNFNPLVKIGEDPVVILDKNFLLFLDTTPFINKDPNMVKILENVGDYFGKKIGIIWEDTCSWNSTVLSDGSILCPDEIIIDNDEIIKNLRSKGYDVETILHSRKLTLSTFNNYDQIWLIRPGWCEKVEKDTPRSIQPYCSKSIKWDNLEISEIKKYAQSRGKVVIFADYSNSMPNRVVNSLLSNLNTEFYIVDGISKSGSISLTSHDITKGISSYPIAAVARIECK